MLTMAVDPARLVAYVVGAGAPVAAVDLRTMRAARHRVAAPALLRDAGCPRLVDTRTWAARLIARRAGAARLAGHRLLVYDGRHPSGRPYAGSGLRVYDRSGRLRRTLLPGLRVGDVQVAGSRAYARTTRGLRVVDLRRGRVIARLPRERRDIDLIAPR
jgi:hypothetical protein